MHESGSVQQASDVNLELQRLQALVRLLQIESGPTFSELDVADAASHEEVSKILRGQCPYSEVNILAVTNVTALNTKSTFAHLSVTTLPRF